MSAIAMFLFHAAETDIGGRPIRRLEHLVIERDFMHPILFVEA